MLQLQVPGCCHLMAEAMLRGRMSVVPATHQQGSRVKCGACAGCWALTSTKGLPREWQASAWLLIHLLRNSCSSSLACQEATSHLQHTLHLLTLSDACTETLRMHMHRGLPATCWLHADSAQLSKSSWGAKLCVHVQQMGPAMHTTLQAQPGRHTAPEQARPGAPWAMAEARRSSRTRPQLCAAGLDQAPTCQGLLKPSTHAARTQTSGQ